MKRSKMVDIMWEFIENIEDDYDRYMSRSSTEALLDKMIEVGMIPPETVRYTDHDNGNTSCAEVCEWDDECD